MLKFIGQTMIMEDSVNKEACIIVRRNNKESYDCLFEDGEVIEVLPQHLKVCKGDDNCVVFGNYCKFCFDESFTDSFIMKHMDKLLKEIKSIKIKQDQS